MKILFKLFATLFSALIFITSTSCSPVGSEVTFYYFNCPVYVQAREKTLSSDQIDQIDALLSSLHNEFDLNTQESFTKTFNDSQIGSNVPLSQTAKKILSLCIKYNRFTDGKFNPAVLPLMNLWQFTSSSQSQFVPPTKAQIEQTLSNYQFDFASIESAIGTNSITKNSNMLLDFGGIVKGYAAQSVAELLREFGIKNGYVSVGTSSLYILHSEKLGVKHPRKDGNLLEINLQNNSFLGVSTSGDYEKYNTYNGVKYSHIIDAESGYPADTGVISATVIDNSSAFLDAFTTALCLASHTTDGGQSELVDLIDRLMEDCPAASFYVVYQKDGVKQLITNKNQGEDFTLIDGDYTVVKL